MARRGGKGGGAGRGAAAGGAPGGGGGGAGGLIHAALQFIVRCYTPDFTILAILRFHLVQLSNQSFAMTFRTQLSFFLFHFPTVEVTSDQRSTGVFGQ